MKGINLNTWQVYYLDNDRQKVVIQSGLSYWKAIKLYQQYNSSGLSCEYESI